MKRRGKTFGRKVLLIIFTFAVILIISTVLSNTLLSVSRFEVGSDKIPAAFDGFKILQLSDLHDKSFGEDNKRLISKVDKENPDMVVMTGDMVNSTDYDFSVFYNLAEIISLKYDTYFIVGNHEQYFDDEKLTELYDQLESYGIEVLDNEYTEITKDNQNIRLYGLWFNLRYYRDLGSEYTKDIDFTPDIMENVISPPDEDYYNILLAHNPVYFSTYSEWGADLVLSGHVHGGIIRLPLVGGLLSPEHKLFPEFDAGRYELDGSNMIVSRGLGNSVILRFCSFPEIGVITLKAE